MALVSRQLREKRQNTDALASPPLTLEALLGEWQGEAVTIYPDLRSSHIYSTRMRLYLENDQLVQNLSFGSPEIKISSKARIAGSILHFDQAIL